MAKQFHQYQQNEQLPLTFYWAQKDYDISRWKNNVNKNTCTIIFVFSHKTNVNPGIYNTYIIHISMLFCFTYSPLRAENDQMIRSNKGVMWHIQTCQ